MWRGKSEHYPLLYRRVLPLILHRRKRRRSFPARRLDDGNSQYLVFLLVELVECSPAFEIPTNLLLLMEACVEYNDAISIEITILLLIPVSPSSLEPNLVAQTCQVVQ